MPFASEDTARQHIPRPVGHRPGGPAPWSRLPPERRRHLDLARITGAIAARGAVLPPDPAQLAIARALSRGVVGDPAAVLVALFEEGGETRVLLTVRAGHLRAHRDEVAFPGGRLDPGETVDAGALREAHEEVGLDPGLVTVLGHLTSLPTASSGTLMTPVVATLPARPEVVRGPGEVERVFDVALADLVADGVFAEEFWPVPGEGGGEFPVWFFEAAGEIIWGATARVLVELVCLAVGVRGPFDP